jgi:hypothetical protein
MIVSTSGSMAAAARACAVISLRTRSAPITRPTIFRPEPVVPVATISNSMPWRPSSSRRAWSTCCVALSGTPAVLR